MELLVVGSVALDSVKTPHGSVNEALGGSATYFSIAASYFTHVNLVAVIGNDFPEEHLLFLKERGIDLAGLKRQEGRTFRWRGEYQNQMNEAKTLATELNVFESFRPTLPPTYLESPYLFLANIDPQLQRDVLIQVKRPKLIACDTMNFWIESKRDALVKMLQTVDLLIINEGEARALARCDNLVSVARNVLSFGPKTLIIKRGEYGAVMFTDHTVFACPAYPLESVCDPTGAGDSFAGGLMGYLSQQEEINDQTLRQGVIYGSVMASYNVEAFSLNRMRHLTKGDITARYQAFKALTAF